ncbi:MAG: glycosyltransferase family 92 protein [Proteobacteria bacterium]|nr:glycosyltransferase family 92 protein [Pseudomonadota bacterium]
MVLALTLLVRNEQDIIAENLTYHLNAGVDFIIVTDHHSDDTTSELIEPFVRSGQVLLRSEPSPEFRQSQWVTTMARSAHSLGADWIMNGDADEFWFTPEASLSTFFSAVEDRYGVVVAHRHDLLPATQDTRPFHESCIYRVRHSTNSHGEPLPPKVAHRASADVTVAFGNHSAIAPGLGGPVDDRSLEILHFPIRAYDQLADKVSIGAAALENTDGIDPEIGKTWRLLRDAYENDQLRQWYIERTIGADAVDAVLASGEIVIDTRLRDILRGLGFTTGTGLHAHERA